MLGFVEKIEIDDLPLENIIDSKEIEEEICPVCSAQLCDYNKTFSLKDMNTTICYKCQRKEFLDEFIAEKKIKIKLYGVHFGWINERLLILFDKTGVRNRTSWIINAAKKDFGVDLVDIESLERFDIVVRVNHYIDKNDWLRDRMRNEVAKCKITI